ncbi:hypothetical protein NliqN6_4518 [Naganishia liquefaciens]|uniref:Zinc-ribbon 15 domain-containing protein n=1 Tax=Naganishia liquefaciens TaxID=104408 RepID=A0A8H3TWD7_9TREE|nr:hypothetical protein NliqN6_4518 [Naganishia liquefaciens]
MDFFCIPIACGCPTKIKQDEAGPARVCPNCHNASVISAKSRTWFEFCFVPLFPFSSDRVWKCGICQWEVERNKGFEPQVAGQGYIHPGQSGQYQQPGYGPPMQGYMPPPQGGMQYPGPNQYPAQGQYGR